MSPRGEFLTALFRILERERVAYCVLRNYENLYDDNSSDVDVAVQPEDVDEFERCLAGAAAASGHRLVQRARFINYSHVYWHSEGGFVRVDFDTSLRWRIFPVLTAKSVVTLRQRRTDFYVPHPRHESVILFLVVIERGALSERYAKRLGELYERGFTREELKRTFRAAFGSIGESLAEAQAKIREESPDSTLWQTARKSIIRNSFSEAPNRRQLWRNVRADMVRLWERMKSPAGISLLYVSAAASREKLDWLLEFVDALFPASKLVVAADRSSRLLQRMRVLFKGGLFVRCRKVERDSELSKAIRAREGFLFPSREFVWAESSDGKAFLANADSGFMAEADADMVRPDVVRFIATGMERLLKTVRAPQRGALVALVGLDGSGKTTVAREICAQAARTDRFSGVRYFHWRPSIFGPADLPLPEFRNVPRKAKLPGNWWRSLISMMRLLKNVALWKVTYRFRVAPLVRRGGLVLVDRYYYNYYLDPVSVKYYGPSWVLDRMSKLFPQPDLAVVLRAPAEVLLARKQELTLEEIARQNALLDRTPFGTRNILEADASQPAATSAGAILVKLEAG